MTGTMQPLNETAMTDWEHERDTRAYIFSGRGVQKEKAVTLVML